MRRITDFLPGALLAQAEEFHAATLALRSVLPEGMAAHVWFGGTRADSAVLVTDSSSWATSLRFSQDIILKVLRDHCRIDCRRVAIRVAPDTAQRPY